MRNERGKGISHSITGILSTKQSILIAFQGISHNLS